MRFGDWKAVGATVYLTRAGEHDLHRWIVVTARLEERQLAAAVDLQVRVRVLHAVDVTDLSGEVEDHIVSLHEMVHRRLLTDVGDVQADAIFDALNVEQVAAVGGNQ